MYRARCGLQHFQAHGLGLFVLGTFWVIWLVWMHWIGLNGLGFLGYPPRSQGAEVCNTFATHIYTYPALLHLSKN
jgi:hypothetical protein